METNPGFLHQAAQIFTDFKEAIGLEDHYPQADLPHKYDYLNDIANGRWEPLNHVQTIDRTPLTWGGQFGCFKLKRLDTKPLLKDIRFGKTLKATATKDRAKPLFEKEWKLKDSLNRRAKLLNEIARFPKNKLSKVQVVDRSAPIISPHLKKFEVEPQPQQHLVSDFITALKTSPSLHQAKDFITESLETVKESIGMSDLHHPQSHIQHNKHYLNDIANGRWNPLKSVETVDKSGLSNWFGDNQSFVLKRINMMPLWTDINHRKIILKHVKPKENPKFYAPNWQLKLVGDTHTKLLNQIQTFDRKKLKHVQIVYKSIPRIGYTRNSHKRAESTVFADIVNAFHSSPSIHQAADFISHQFDNVKEALSFSEMHPQAHLKHKRGYLDDIANGRWNTLKSVETVDKSKIGYWSLKFAKAKTEEEYARKALWQEIKSGKTLLRVEPVDKSASFPKAAEEKAWVSQSKPVAKH